MINYIIIIAIDLAHYFIFILKPIKRITDKFHHYIVITLQDDPMAI